MEIKTYEQMESDFKEFYFKKIKPLLVKYENERKNRLPKIILFSLFFFSFFLTILGGFLYEYVPMIKNIKYLECTFGILFAFAMLSGFGYYYMTKNDSANSLEFSSDDKFKKVLMRSFLKIFSNNVDWYKANYLCEKSENNRGIVDTFRKTNIFNSFPYLLLDDTIYLVFKNVQINIYEINTAILNKYAVFLLPFCLLLLFLLITQGFSLLLLVSVFMLPIVLIILPTFVIILFISLIYIIKKYIQYAPFKGVVVELKMNKKFKGHTFFLNKSFNSKKFTINHKKYEKIQLESVNFMNKYEVFSTDQIEARYILTTAMIDRLENLKLAFKANYIRGSFKDDKLILAIDTGKDMFAMGNDFKESNLQTFRALFNEIISIMKIVDQLKLDEKTGL